MSWISKNLTLDLLAIAIDGLTKSFDRIKSEPEPGTEWPAAEVPAQAPAAVEPPAPVQQPPAATPVAQPSPTEMHTTATPQPEPAPEPAEAPQPTVDRRPEAQTHLRDISLSGGMDWITGTLFPSFGVQNLNDVPVDKLPDLINTATAYKLEKGLN